MSSTQRFFSSLLVGLAATCSLISMSLSAWHIAFVNNPPGGSRAPLAIRYWEPATSENLTSLMPYVPSRWTMRDLHALVATGTIGTIGGSLAAVLQWTAYPTGQQKSRESEKIRYLRLSNRFLAILHALLLTSLTVGFALSWSTYEQGRGAYFWALQDRGAYPWNFERWNCAVSWSVNQSRSAVRLKTLRSLCKQARVARVLMLCAFVLAALALAIQLSIWRKQGRDQAWRGEDRREERDSQARTVAVKEHGSEAASLEMPTPGEAEARGDRN